MSYHKKRLKMMRLCKHQLQ